MADRNIETELPPSLYLSLTEIMQRKLVWDWLVEKLLKRGNVYQLHGQSKAGKSLVALDMALHLAQGKDWCGRRSMHAMVVYVAGEAVEDIEARIQAFAKARGLEEDAPFYLRTKPVYLTGEAYAQGLADEIAELQKDWPNMPVAVFVDTLARNFGSGKSESSDADMGAFVNNVIDLVTRPHNATAVIVHHPGHGAKDRGRGHSSLPGAVDGTLMVEQ
ncbi:MAG: AAA family ATPase [Chromatiaceae bacterium]|nr:AAA family ATPase [Chromatiaceae bacterium]MCP5315989.1 AAA family ATPase [Chromatiaceae bacterium]